MSSYTFDGVGSTPLMYKIIMHLATIDSVATAQTLRNNLQLLGVHAATVNGNIDNLHNKFDKNYSQLIARGATIDNPIGILFEAYLVVPCHNFKSYIHQQHKDYLDGKHTSITHMALMIMTSAKCKFDWLKRKGMCGAKSPDDKKTVAMTPALNALKGQLKLDPKLSTNANNRNKKGNNTGKQKKNKKNTSNQREQKKDEAWKKEPPKDGEKQEKQDGKCTYHWCELHMAWTAHKPADCMLGNQRKEEEKKNPQKANSATVAAAIATVVDIHFAALMATMPNLEEW
jgi:hypothetical protein